MSSAKALLGSIAGRFLFRAATVTSIERIGRAFVQVHVEGEDLRGARAARVGDTWQLFGPRRSIDTSATDGPLVVAGDETSIAVGVATARARPGRVVSAVLESTDPEDTRAAAHALGLERVEVVQRGAAAPILMGHVEQGASPVFTGRAATIQALQRDLRARSLRHRGPTKAYWAEGRRGLD